MREKKIISERIYQEPCVWVKVAKLVDEYSPVDLGIGKPDVETDQFIKDALINTQSLPDSINQYTNSRGHPKLTQILSQFYSKLMGRDINPTTDICTTNGADGSIFCTAMALINPGDEAIIFEPYYDSFVSTVALAQGVPVFVALKMKGCNSSSKVTFDRNELANAFNEKTKLIFVNSPHNPTGKVFNLDELQYIADLCLKYNVICVCDYVYEHYNYSNAPHIYMNTLKNMWQRTITIASAGKAFNVTGWKLGWSIGPKYLIDAIHTIHSICNYTCPSVIQEAVATCLELQLTTPNIYWQKIRQKLLKKRDTVVEAFNQIGLECVVPEAGYFLIVNFEPIVQKYLLKCDKNNSSDTNDNINHMDYLDEFDVVKWLIKSKKLMGVPLGPFYSPATRHVGKCYVRFSFFKKQEQLELARNIILQIQ